MTNDKKAPKSKYTYFQALYKSFYSGPLYADVAKRWSGLGIGYLFFILVLASLPLSVRLMINFNQFFEQQIVRPLEQLPELPIHYGYIRFEKPMPFLIKNSSEEVLSIIDTTGKITGIDDTYPYLRVLITKNKLYLRLPNFKQFLGLSKSLSGNTINTRSFNYKENGTFSGVYWLKNSGVMKIKSLVQLLIFPVLILFFLGLYLCFIVIFASLGQLISNTFFSHKIQYKAAFRLLAIACTPQIIFYFSLKALQIPLPGLVFYSLFFLISYYYYAIFSVRH